MEIKFKNKPSKDSLDRYCRKVEYYLSGLGITLEIVLLDMPFISESSFDNSLVFKEFWWLEDFIVTSQLGILKLKNKPRFGIDDSISDEDIWSDAWSIQNEFYKNYKLPLPNPDDQDDPYWNLWKKIERY